MIFSTIWIFLCSLTLSLLVALSNFFQNGSSIKKPPSCEMCTSLQATIDRLRQEKEDALRVQQEGFQRQLADIAKNRRHLEEERIKILRHKLQLEMEEKMQDVCHSWTEESTEAVQEACEKVKREAEKEREKAIRAAKEEAEVYYEQRVRVAVSEALADEQRKEELQRAELRKQHAEELRSFQEKLQGVQEQLKSVICEKMDFESRFQELQLNYKRFIDLTDSALHSDYLLRLIRLGKPPGYAHCAVQTDDESPYP
ncbi:uncharacterized protein PAF06_010077 [Gastrophryne carolinensis]